MGSRRAHGSHARTGRVSSAPACDRRRADAPAVTSPSIGRQHGTQSIKISEFRQKWIDDLRNDISAYVGAAEKWFRKWDEINPLPSEKKEKREREDLFPIANDARVILHRIKLRFNPEDNPDKATVHAPSL